MQQWTFPHTAQVSDGVREPLGQALPLVIPRQSPLNSSPGTLMNRAQGCPAEREEAPGCTCNVWGVLRTWAKGYKAWRGKGTGQGGVPWRAYFCSCRLMPCALLHNSSTLGDRCDYYQVELSHVPHLLNMLESNQDELLQKQCACLCNIMQADALLSCNRFSVWHWCTSWKQGHRAVPSHGGVVIPMAGSQGTSGENHWPKVMNTYPVIFAVVSLLNPFNIYPAGDWSEASVNLSRLIAERLKALPDKTH